MYVGQDIPLDDLIAQGVNKGTCDQLLQRITGVYAAMAAEKAWTAAGKNRYSPACACAGRHDQPRRDAKKWRCSLFPHHGEKKFFGFAGNSCSVTKKL